MTNFRIIIIYLLVDWLYTLINLIMVDRRAYRHTNSSINIVEYGFVFIRYLVPMLFLGATDYVLKAHGIFIHTMFMLIVVLTAMKVVGTLVETIARTFYHRYEYKARVREVSRIKEEINFGQDQVDEYLRSIEEDGDE